MITTTGGSPYTYRVVMVTCDKCRVHHTLVFTGLNAHCEQRNNVTLHRVYRNELLDAQWAVNNDTWKEKHICPHCLSKSFLIGARTVHDTSWFSAFQKLRDTELCPQCKGLGVLSGKEIGRARCTRCDGSGKGNNI